MVSDKNWPRRLVTKSMEAKLLQKPWVVVFTSQSDFFGVVMLVFSYIFDRASAIAGRSNSLALG